MTLNPDDEIFIVYVAFLACFDLGLEIHSFRKIQMVFLKAHGNSISIFSKYADFSHIFFKDLRIKLPKNTKINNCAIDLFVGQQTVYGLIYSLELIQLKTLKIYIKNNLAIDFIRPSMFFASAFISFVKKSNSSL